MNIVILQLTNLALRLIPVTQSGGRAVFDAPVTFELPEELSQQQAFEDLPSFAAFARQCLAVAQCGGRQAMLFLDGDRIISRQYSHLPTKKNNLNALASLEAESVLTGAVSDYLVENYEYDTVPPVSGEYRSVLYAVPKELISGLKKAFSHEGIRLNKVTPSINSLICSCQLTAGADPEFSRQAVAVADFGFAKNSLVVFREGVPIFERSFDTVYEEILGIVMTELQYDYRSAADFLQSAPAAGLSDTAKNRIQILLEASVGEVMRTIGMVISSERLELSRFLLSGGMASLPLFTGYLSALETDIPYKTVDQLLNGGSRFISVSAGAGAKGNLLSSYFGYVGAVLAPKGQGVNFLRQSIAKADSRRNNAIVLSLVTVLAVFAMLIQPYIYTLAASAVNEDNKKLSNPSYGEVDAARLESSVVSAQLENLKKDAERLVSGKAPVLETVQKLHQQLTSRVAAVSSLSIDNQTGAIACAFIVNSLEEFVAVKNSVMDAAYFIVQVPFTIIGQNEDETISCSVTLLPKDFTPPSTGGGSSASASSSPSGDHLDELANNLLGGQGESPAAGE